MRTIALLCLIACGCQTKTNLKYCDRNTPCTVDGFLTCDFVKHECQPTEDLAMLEPEDMSSAEDLQELADMTVLPDLQEPDLTPPPDLTTLPDLVPPTPYFIPDIEAILDAHTCARAGCHNAVTPGLYAPLLIPSPSATVAQHQNYTNFSAETQATVLLKLINDNGTKHGGIGKNDPDLKPCASAISEPCATLTRWYVALMPENAP